MHIERYIATRWMDGWMDGGGMDERCHTCIDGNEHLPTCTWIKVEKGQQDWFKFILIS